MNEAAGNLAHSLRQHETVLVQHEAFLSSWLERFEAAIGKLSEPIPPR